MRSTSSALTLLLGIAVGFGGGWILGRGSEAESVPREEFERLERRLDEALARAARKDPPPAPPRAPSATEDPASRGGHAAPPQNGADVAPANDGGGPAPDPERAREVRDLAATIDRRFEERDGEGLLEVLRKLSLVVPEGREAAMSLTLRLLRDVRGERALGIDEVTFYSTLGDSGTRDLLVWSLAHPSPAEFRVVAAFCLPWVLPREAALDSLVRALRGEKDATVQQALVGALWRMRDSRVDAAVAALFLDRALDPAVRARAASILGETKDEAVVRALREAASSDADPRVRAAARGALQLREPPVDGYALLVVYPDGAAAAADLRPGDIIVTYDGRPVRTTDEFQAAIEAASETADGARETVEVAFLREGAEALASVRRGKMGIQGRVVRKP
jgi:hypothetical protein